VTTKYFVKLTSEGLVDKIALRGYLIRENIVTSNTWCPIAGFRALKIFLAFPAECKQRLYQLDYVAAFLQADMNERRFSSLTSEKVIVRRWRRQSRMERDAIAVVDECNNRIRWPI
jgi:aspartate-semialdehyde dehydrogenase